MNLKTIQMGICVAILIALLCSAGCTFLSGGDNAAPTSSTTPTVTTKMPTVKVTTTISVVPTSASGVAASGTTDPWANFVEPTSTPEKVGTEEPTVVETEAPTPEITETSSVDNVPLTEEPTAIPTIVSVPYTCSYIGGNLCMANETCSGAFVKTTDEAQCCAGVCEAH